MADRYFVDEPISLGQIVLAGPEAHHLIHVMRATVGTCVVLFDGSGTEFPAVVERVGRSNVELAVIAREEVDRELPFDLTLGVALPKGDRQKWLVEKAVELGVTRIVPLETERSVAQPVDQALARLRRSVIEASKQCGRNRLLRIEPPRCWPEFVRDGEVSASRLLAHPGVAGKAERVDLHAPDQTMAPCSSARAAEQSNVQLAVGPEGGFTEDEVALAVAAGWGTVDLGPRILRIETAALLLASIVATARRT